MMPKAKNPITDEERSRRFEEEVRKRKAAGDFDSDAAEAAVAAVVKRSRNHRNG
jgi:chorismate mutase